MCGCKEGVRYDKVHFGRRTKAVPHKNAYAGGANYAIPSSPERVGLYIVPDAAGQQHVYLGSDANGMPVRLIDPEPGEPFLLTIADHGQMVMSGFYVTSGGAGTAGYVELLLDDEV